jgi:hypothetical protein
MPLCVLSIPVARRRSRAACCVPEVCQQILSLRASGVRAAHSFPRAGFRLDGPQIGGQLVHGAVSGHVSIIRME